MSKIIKDLGGVLNVERLLKLADEQNKYWFVKTSSQIALAESLILTDKAVIPTNYTHISKAKLALERFKKKKNSLIAPSEYISIFDIESAKSVISANPDSDLYPFYDTVQKIYFRMVKLENQTIWQTPSQNTAFSEIKGLEERLYFVYRYVDLNKLNGYIKKYPLSA